eukprot:Gb_35368 [translate_table: standard]
MWNDLTPPDLAIFGHLVEESKGIQRGSRDHTMWRVLHVLPPPPILASGGWVMWHYQQLGFHVAVFERTRFPASGGLYQLFLALAHVVSFGSSGYVLSILGEETLEELCVKFFFGERRRSGVVLGSYIGVAVGGSIFFLFGIGAAARGEVCGLPKHPWSRFPLEPGVVAALGENFH